MTEPKKSNEPIPLTENALSLLRRRYLKKDADGNVVETPEEMFRRVAKAVASANGDKDYEEKFYGMMARLEFLPNSPTLMNGGTDLGQLSACFVLPVDDNIESIMDGVKNTVLIHKSGGGTGFSFSRLRPKNDVVRSTGGVASGPISFMRVYDVATDVIKQGGKRRGANMGILHVSHPDIMDWLVMKETEGAFSNFNISVGVTDKFMRAVKNNRSFGLVNPRTGKVVKSISARAIWNLLITMAWRNGEPGIVFFDEINRKNPLPKLGKIEATNPCAEQPLHPYESCNLGSVNLSAMVKDGAVDWEKLRGTVRLAVRFLDDVIDVNNYPLPQIGETTKENRKIGLGVMGFADMLIKLGVRYNSRKALALASRVMACVTECARNESAKLGKERGSFPNFPQSDWSEHYEAMRNATVTTIAPTGSISIIAGCSSGIEPVFSYVVTKKLADSLGTDLTEVHPLLAEELAKRGIAVEDFASHGNLDFLPRKTREVFVAALDLTAEDHVRMQAAFQKHVDNAVSKTINFPESATITDVETAFLLAHRLGCKGLTVYRNNSRNKQVLVGAGKASAKAKKCPTCQI